MTTFINVADIPDPSDPEHRTSRQINAAKTHGIPIGALVEVGDPEYPNMDDGIRLFVVHQGRDCDETPLYWLCADSEDTVQRNPRFMNPKWVGGYPEYSLTVIRLPAATS